MKKLWISFFTSVFLFGANSLTLFASGLPGAASEDAQEEDVLAKNRIEAGAIYRKLFEKGPNAEWYAKLAELYFAEERPIQAKFYAEMALSQAPEDETIQAQFEQMQNRIDYLDQRFRMYAEKSNRENDPHTFGSMAAIKFHQGYVREAFTILEAGISRYGRNAPFASLVQTFQKDINEQLTILGKLNNEFNAAVPKGELGTALDRVGQMVFISLGNPDVLKFLVRFKQAYPQAVNEESYLLLTEFTKMYPNLEQ